MINNRSIIDENNYNNNFSSTVSKKRVEFLLDEQGDPWTWVMGEHSGDKSIEQILEEETREAARRLAEKEAQTLRYRVLNYISNVYHS